MQNWQEVQQIAACSQAVPGLPCCHTASKFQLTERIKTDLGSVYPANERTLPITLFFPAGDDDDEKQRNRHHPGEPIITLRRFASCFKKTMLVTQAEENTVTGRPHMHVVTQGGAGKGSESAHTHVRRHANAPNATHSHIQSHK